MNSNDYNFQSAEAEWLREPEMASRCEDCGKKNCQCDRDYDETE